MTPELDVGAVAPMIAVGLGAVFLPLAEVMLSRWKTFLSQPVTEAWIGSVLSLSSAIVLLVAFAFTAGGFAAGPRVFNAEHPMVLMDGFTHFLNGVVLVAALMTVLVSQNFLHDMRINHGEYYALLLASVLGMMFLTAATDLMMLFLALETMSIPVYALAGFRRSSLRSNESAVKYFLIGSFASGILLYGCALLYGATGSIVLAEIAEAFDPESALALLGAGLVLIGLAFKIASVPFHQWAPDVYEGAPTTVTGFMSTAVKVAAFGALIRVFDVAFAPAESAFQGAFWGLAVLTMTVGNVMAIIQQNVKRLLAYSSVAHAGYLLVGLATGTDAAQAAMLFYLLVYTFMTLGAFTVIAILAREGEERELVSDLTGLGTSRPFLAAVMAVSMFSLAGIPGFAGFMGKFYLFRAAVERSLAVGDSMLLWLAIIAVLNSALSLVYYLRIPIVMYMREPAGGEEAHRASTFEGLVLATCLAATVLLGIFPENLYVLTEIDALGWASSAVASLRLTP